MIQTPLDRAFAEMTPEDDASRLRFLGRLAAAEVFLLLKEEPTGKVIDAQVFPIDPEPVALIFDTEDRLTSFHGGPAPYAAMSGRSVAQVLAGQGIGLGLNLGTGVSDFVLSSEGLNWLADVAVQDIGAQTAKLVAVHAPKGVPDAVITEIDARLAGFEGQASRAYLALGELENGGTTHVLVVVNAHTAAQRAIAEAVNAALVFSGVEAAALDVTFVEDQDALIPRLEAVGLRIDLPEPEVPSTPAAPGLDPDAPPRLR
ncbi:MAG: SseB family protein [Rhodobacteraceae bacterium]|nr:SseB family protein [Paracoccaceae bacterium]